ncbi:tetratricopeptide repeat protein, partial [Streptomyces sp. NPDC058665]|uniref:tetratricopeptide repeat protein n=1 Tax=Streptomyces sp. NPDC058665 TaxID=3346586 RepID=UPI003669A00C
NLGRAITLYEQTLTDRLRILGKDHPDTLASRNNLAAAYWSAEDPGRAITLFEQALIDSARLFGENHPMTRVVRDNLQQARSHPR